MLLCVPNLFRRRHLGGCVACAGECECVCVCVCVRAPFWGCWWKKTYKMRFLALEGHIQVLVVGSWTRPEQKFAQYFSSKRASWPKISLGRCPFALYFSIFQRIPKNIKCSRFGGLPRNCLFLFLLFFFLLAAYLHDGWWRGCTRTTKENNEKNTKTPKKKANKPQF